MSAIRTTDLTRRFGTFTAVDRVNLTVERGEIFGFLGPNGSGKTTVIKMLCGLLPMSGGDAWVDGIDVRHHPDLVRTRIGYMSQKFALYDDLTVLENLRFYGRVYGLYGATLETRIARMVEDSHISPYLQRLAGRLSGGWKQRLALACAMLHDPTILYLDEPTAGIDPVARRQLWDLLFHLSAQGITFFVTTHYMDEAERCSHLAYIYYGQIIADGTPATLRTLPDITPPGTHRYEITTDEVTRALALARTWPDVHNATIFGRSIHILVDVTLSGNELAERLRAAGMAVEEIRSLLPSLEDVFVELTLRRQCETAESGAAL
ncbi:ABC-2 type transport system ATP-binding protein [Gammaproteobacteria bacterium]